MNRKKASGKDDRQNPARRGLTVLPLAMWCLLIFILSSVPGNKYPKVQWEHADKLVHLALYFWVGVFAWIFFNSTRVKARAIAAGIFGCLYGLSDEIHQIFVPRRSFSLYDWFADTVGVIIGIVLIFALHQRRTSSTNFQHDAKSESAERMEVS